MGHRKPTAVIRTGDETPALVDAYCTVLDACRAHGKSVGVGGLSSRLDLARRFVDARARHVSVGTDLSFLIHEAEAALADLSLE
ncbi:hypothetical protein EV643_103477 [Kribbella sp. VKM Ac-2527]|uniref:Uncharacterized protein n=1 Tax=Kribbella caucasensis TaxID=2512215 RepID=A0A4R6KK86_9ACTN|nr:hypothetical protein [Kribbella sp. VKM Ac-2527]TDO51738.1 hypothetical protein EV643_103477 [Kribbella sp. VKM Ac-2527]